MTTVMDKEVGSPIEVRLRAHDGWRPRRAGRRDRLVDLGCPLAQGYLFARPLDGPAAGAFLHDRAKP